MAAPPEALVKQLENKVSAERYNEDLLNWKPTTVTTWSKICIDQARHNLIIENVDGTVEVIEISQMSDVRSRPYMDETPKGCLDESKDICFLNTNQQKLLVSVAYYEGHVDFVHVHLANFIMENEDIANIWRTGLQYLIRRHYQLASRHVTIDEKLERIFSYLIASQGKTRSVKAKLLGRWFKDAQLAAVKVALSCEKELDMSMFSLDDFKNKIIDAVLLHPAKLALQQIIGKKAEEPEISVKQMVELVNKEHRDPRWNEVNQPEINEGVMRSRMKQFTQSGQDKSALGVKEFFKFLTSDWNDVLQPNSRVVAQDMTKPLAHYYCNSSHNSYLIAKQVLGRSTVEIYRQILLSGCRCLELDIWNGEAVDGSNTCIITHGGARCTNVLFSDCLKAIRDTAFVASEYPVILSFENHADAPNQAKVARDCKAIFGDLLCSEYMSGDGGIGKQLPSPDKLKRKIIIKNKRMKSLVVQDKGVTSPTRGGNAADMEIGLKVDGEMIMETEQERLDREARSKDIVKELSDIVNYVWPVHFRGFDVAAATKNCYHMSSFNERKGLKLVAGDPEAFVRYTSQQIARIYPHGARIQSSNYNPVLFWNVGAQLVALNFQTIDTAPMHRNIGKFIHNGGCGYVLKPAPMMGRNFDPFRKTTIDTVPALAVKVQVLAAPCVGGVHPQVEVKIQGLPLDTTKEPMKTRSFKRKHPVAFWGSDNTADFPMIILPEAALLEINVTDHYNGDKSLGWSVLTLSEMKPGYRFIPLQYANSPLAHVLVKISMSIFSGNHGDFADRLADPTKFSRKTDRNLNLMKALDDSEITDEVDGDTEASGGHDSSGASHSTSAGPHAGVLPFSAPVARAPTAAGRQNNYEIYDSVEKNDEVRGFQEVCNNILNSSLQSSKSVLQRDEPKAIVSLREQQIKKRNKCMAEHNKVVKLLRASFVKALKQVFKDKVPTVKKSIRKSTKKGQATSTQVSESISVVQVELIELESDFKQKLRDAFENFLELVHPVMREQEHEIGKEKVAQVTKIHRDNELVVDKKLQAANGRAIADARKKFNDVANSKGKKPSKDEWAMFEEAMQNDLMSSWETTKRQVLIAHNKELGFVKSEVKASEEELQNVQDWDRTTILKQHETEEELLNKLKTLAPNDPDRIKWETMSADQYLDALVAMGRIPDF